MTNLAECIKPISYVKANAAEMMAFVNERREPLVITQNGESRAVLVDVQTYQDMRNAFSLLKIIQLSQGDIKAGRAEKAEAVFAGLRKEFCADGN